MAGYVVDEGVGLVVVINKWDLVEKDDRTFDEYSARLRAQAPFLGFAPIVAVSAKTGQRVGRALDAAVEIARGRRRRIATGALNRVLSEATYRQPPPPGAQSATQVLLRDPGVHRAADVRAVRERRGARPFQLPAVPREPAAGCVRVRRHADPRIDRRRAIRVELEPRAHGAAAVAAGSQGPRSRARARPGGRPRGQWRQAAGVGTRAGAGRSWAPARGAPRSPVLLAGSVPSRCWPARPETRGRCVSGHARERRPTCRASRLPDGVVVTADEGRLARPGSSS